MKSKPILFFLVVTCSITLNSCFTGKVYHHPRVKVEPVPVIDHPHEIHSEITADDSLKRPDLLSIRDSNIAERTYGYSQKNQERVIKNNSAKRPDIIPKSRFKKRSIPGPLPRKDWGDALAGFFAILYFLIIGLPSLALLITGFCLGLAGIMVGFWICWVIGMLGMLFSAVLWTIAWASEGGETLLVVSSLAYLILFCLAIAFLLIVLI